MPAGISIPIMKGSLWTPRMLAAELWLDPRRLVTGTTTVTNWANSGAAAINPMTAATTKCPATGTGINGRPTIDFDGTTDVMKSTSLANTVITASLWSCLVVFRYTGTATEDPGNGDANAGPIGDNGPAGGAGGYWGPSTSATKFDNHIFTGGSKVQEQFTITAPSNHFAICQQFGGKIYTSFDGAALTAGTTAGSITAINNSLAVGISADQSVFYKGSVGDIIVSKRQWTAAEIALLNHWVQGRYGL